jgi:selenocysteine lyase/cysteine desulfurase
MTQQPRHRQFPLDRNILYFNHAAVSPWPRCTADAIKQFTDQNLHTGSKHYPEWMETEQQLRELLRWLINAESADDIALLKNTSEGLSVIAYGLEWSAGDNVVIPAGEFPSNRIVWESLRQFGVETRQIDILSADDPEKALIEAMDVKTRLLSVSAVQYSSGFRLNLEKLGAGCRHHNVLFAVDAIQQLGALQFDQQQIQADFIVADGHKWMMGPEGLALFYCKSAVRPRINLKQYGWRMIENPVDFLQHEWRIADTAKRFECGSPNMLAIFALHASINLIKQTGKQIIEESILNNIANINEYVLNSKNYQLLINTDKNRLSGITNFRHRDLDSHALFKTLTEQGVQCAERGQGIRLSPHFYHRQWEFERLFEILDKV